MDVESVRVAVGSARRRFVAMSSARYVCHLVVDGMANEIRSVNLIRGLSVTGMVELTIASLMLLEIPWGFTVNDIMA